MEKGARMMHLIYSIATHRFQIGLGLAVAIAGVGVDQGLRPPFAHFRSFPGLYLIIKFNQIRTKKF